MWMWFFSAYAFAELIDNALTATVENSGKREIEIRLVCLRPTCNYCVFIVIDAAIKRVC